MDTFIKALPLSSSPHQTVGLMNRVFDNSSITRKKSVENGRNITTSTNKTRDHGIKCSAGCSLLVTHSRQRNISTTLFFNTMAISSEKIVLLFFKSTSSSTFAAASSSDQHSSIQSPLPLVSVDEVERSPAESVLTLPLAPVNDVDTLSVDTIATKMTDPKTQSSNAAKALESDNSTLEKKAKSRPSTKFHQSKERNPKLIRSSDQLLNKLEHYELLKYPLLTESAIKIMESNNTLVFVVDVKADKKMIRAAITELCGVQTKKVNTSIRPDGTKKAFVELASVHNASDVARKIGMI